MGDPRMFPFVERKTADFRFWHGGHDGRSSDEKKIFKSAAMRRAKLDDPMHCCHDAFVEDSFLL
jgi:hypothetical protein